MKTEVRVCDVYGHRKGVKSYGVAVLDEEGNAVLDLNSVDLCPRALTRLKRFIEKGCTPGKKKKAAKECVNVSSLKAQAG